MMNLEGLQGMSGSPILNGRGEFVSVLTMANSNIAYGVKREYLKQFMDGSASVGVTCAEPRSWKTCSEQAVDKTRHMAETLGNPVAQYSMWYVDGQVPGNIEWLYRSARGGFKNAQYQLGKTLEDMADNDASHRQEALQWLELSAKHGHARAQMEVAFAHFFGRSGYRQNKHLAFAQMKKAADQGFNPAMYNVGVMM